jgi:3-oxoacyl-[acyl-carrier protein] reductase
MLLENKRAVIYGGGGAIGRAVAGTFAREGATVFLAGRTLPKLEAVADSIRAERGSAVHTAVVDALDPADVERHAADVAATAGGIDVSFNLISHGDVQGTPMVEMDVEDYLRPVTTAVRTTLLTASAAAKHMRGQETGGVILMFGGAADPPRGFHLGGLQTAFHAMEAMRRQLSSELAPDGVRVITLKTSGVPETVEAGPRRDAIGEMVRASTLLGRAATRDDVGNAAAFAASDRGRTLTAAAINISCGTFMD